VLRGVCYLYGTKKMTNHQNLTLANDPAWMALQALPIEDIRSQERCERWKDAIREIRDGRYERPSEMALP
jgi:hypothetical protein